MKPHKQLGKGALELSEEAFHLLRRAPGSTLFSYYLGSLPFILGLLYFWSDMSRSAFAEQRLAVGAFGLSLLFFWMKCWQAVFAQQVLAQLCGEPAPRWTFFRLVRAGLIQSVLQPSGLFLLPVAVFILVPFAWVYAFYQNVTALAAREDGNLKMVFKKAWQQSLLWPMQNHYVLLCFKVFGLFVFLNLITAVLAVPYLLKILLGVETPFMQSYWTVLNTTFFAAILGLTYLCIDPLLKTIYVLRCFYGESLQTGQDLKVELNNFRSAAKVAALLFLFLGFAGMAPICGAPSSENAVSTPPATRSLTPAAPSVSASQLDQSIERIIQQREYSWRLPREKTDKQQKGALAAFFESMTETVKDWLKALGRSIENFMKWLLGRFRWRGSQPGCGIDWISAVQGLFLVLILGLVVVLALLLFRIWQRRQRRPLEDITAQAAAVVPDLADENVGADRLPEDGWLKLGRELLERGELRLALRAFYLASLADLAERNLITLAKFKSNRDYERELGRRGHALPGVMDLFTQNVSVFDRVWYGLHKVDREILRHFASNVERIKAN